MIFKEDNWQKTGVWYYQSYRRCWYVRREVFEYLTEKYPALRGGDKKAVAYRCLLGYLVFGALTPTEDYGQVSPGHVVLPFETVAALVGEHPKGRGFSALAWIESFSKNVFPLFPTPHQYTKKKARVMRPDLPLELLRYIRRRNYKQTDNHVWLDTGEPVSVRTLKERFQKREESIKRRQNLPEGHPAERLMHYLEKQPQRRLTTLIEQNWPNVEEAVANQPESTDQECRTKDWCERLIATLRHQKRLYYAPSSRTPRIFAVGENLLQLPRDIRKIAMAGTVECDLKAAQLAIAARLWDIPEMTAFLASGGSIWNELASAAKVPVAECKPILKKTVYSILYGMSRPNLRKQLRDGNGADTGIGRIPMGRVWKHYLIRALLKARTVKHREARKTGALQDAWGQWRYAKREHGRLNVASLWAQVIQGYEMRLVMAMLPLLEREPQVYLIAWQHDGVSLYFGNKTKAERQVGQVVRLVEEEVRSMGVMTALEVVR